MSLENTQSFTNSQRVAAGNVSASNDPSQWRHDGTEQLLKGAELAGAGRLLGLSEEETLAAVSRQYRRQRRADDRVSPQDVVRQMAQSLATTKSDVGTAEIDGVGYFGNDDEAFAFGEDVDYHKYNKGTRADDEQTFRGDDRGFTIDEETGLVRKNTFEENRGSQDPVAPKSALIDALARLQKGTQEYGYDAFPGSADVAGRLEAQIAADTGADASLGREAVRRDNARFNPEVEEANYYRAETEALAERRRLYGSGGIGAKADGNIARIGEIHSIGKAYTEDHEIRSANDAIQGQIARRHDGVFLDPVTGNPVATQGPELPPVLSGDRTPNNTGTADNLNAPQTAREWLTMSLGQSLDRWQQSDRIPQVDITSATTNFANKVRDYYRKSGLEQSTTVPPNIRSAEELQRVVDRVVNITGGNLTMPDPDEPGAQMPAGRNQVSGALNALGLTLGEQREFGQAMYQLDTARRSSVNQNPTDLYFRRENEPAAADVTFDAGDVIDKRVASTSPVARIPKGSTIRVGTTDKGKPIRRSIVTQLSQLEGRDAQKPFMGQVQGEKPRVNRMRGKGVGEGADAGIAVRKQAEKRARGKGIDAGRVRENQVKAMLVGERAKRDDAKREEQRKAIQPLTPANLRQVGRYVEADSDIGAVEHKIRENKNARQAEKDAERRRLTSRRFR